MSRMPRSRFAFSPELALVVLLPLLTLVAGAAMIRVASSFGFTALGEPVPMQAAAPAADAR